MKREPINKKLRFEVFKRDSFKCQYCGKSAPDVVLEIDHIKPIAEGGDNNIMNLITSCRDCNRGKGKYELDDNAVVVKQKKVLDELNERKEQIEMMSKWRDDLKDINERSIALIEKILIDKQCKYNNSYRTLTEHGKNTFLDYIDRFGIDEVCTAIDISFKKYYDGGLESFNDACVKVGGICYNREKAKAKKSKEDLYETKILLDDIEKNAIENYLESIGQNWKDTFTFSQIYDMFIEFFEIAELAGEHDAEQNS